MNYDFIINTCGACSGNPGSMGIGGIITEEKSKKIICEFSLFKGIGNHNEAEMLAIIQSIQALENINMNGRRVLFQCSSHLAVEQLNTKRILEKSDIQELKIRIIEYIGLLECESRFSWISRDKNKSAIALAAIGANLPVAYFENEKIMEWDHALVEKISNEDIEKLPTVNKNTMFEIERLNNSRDPSLSSIFSLMTYGIDKYSRANYDVLLDFIKFRFGSYTREYMIKVLVDSNSIYCKNVLRWVARGLYPNLAFIKASLEIEIKDNEVYK